MPNHIAPPPPPTTAIFFVPKSTKIQKKILRFCKEMKKRERERPLSAYHDGRSFCWQRFQVFRSMLACCLVVNFDVMQFMAHFWKRVRACHSLDFLSCFVFVAGDPTKMNERDYFNYASVYLCVLCFSRGRHIYISINIYIYSFVLFMMFFSLFFPLPFLSQLHIFIVQKCIAMRHTCHM